VAGSLLVSKTAALKLIVQVPAWGVPHDDVIVKVIFELPTSR
jgi:hypothetical protein